MTVSANLSDDGSEVTIAVSGRFDFSMHQRFREAHERFSGASKRYVVDMSNADYMDSSALGMLLILRENAGVGNSRIKISNCKEDLRNILTIANFDQLFDID